MMHASWNNQRHLKYQNAQHGLISAAAHAKPFVVCINRRSEEASPQTDPEGFTKYVWKPKQPIPLQFEAVTVHALSFVDLDELQIKYLECDPQAESWTGMFGGESLTLTKPNFDMLGADVARALQLYNHSKAETDRLKAQYQNAVCTLQQKCSMNPNKHVFGKTQHHQRTCTRCGYVQALVYAL